MKRLCVLVTRNPEGADGLERVFGGLHNARGSGLDVAVYLLGDGVLLAKDGGIGDGVRKALAEGVMVFAGSKDIKARGIGSVVEGVEISEDLEGLFIDDAMEKADKVITW
jgi:sulfur transfer complex TusBCD TusB component (DsrH family)